ncbi:MAG: DUF4982 domain-containing protein, partial [Candidatus Sumerlaeota bacterium]|nr:DUF4982 domain-containing protein [Candidatus Sumerlaeota bacterium]
PYEVYHFYRSQWTEEPMAHILTHWDWPGEEGKTRRVVVFTNGKSAGLFLNGKSLGKKKPRREKWKLLPHPPIEWEVEYQPGELRVVARGRKKQGGGEAPVPSEVEAPVPSRVEATDRRRTSGAPAEVVLKPEPDEIHADGRDVSFITATIVDAEGNRCYRADREIEITVSGAAKLAGPARLLA